MGLFSLNGLRAFITGGAGSMGLSTAIAFAKQGADVIITDVREDGINKAVEEFNRATGKEVHAIVHDLSDLEKTKSLFNEAEKKFGNIDILVNNAGVIDKNEGTPFENMSESQLDRVLNINFKSQFFLTQQALPKMVERKFGRIINVSSIVAFTGNPGHVNYSSSKAAIIALTKTVALECARKGVTANCIAPGAIETNMTNALTDNIIQGLNAVVPAGCMGTPEDIAAAITFLASKEAVYITGQTIHVNGGWLEF